MPVLSKSELIAGGLKGALADNGIFALSPQGRAVAFLGDSITNGSSADITNRTFPYQTIEMLGGGVSGIGAGSVVSGWPGAKSTDLATKLADVIATGCKTLALLAGTNDAGRSDGTEFSLSAYISTMTGIFQQAAAAGMQIYIMTIPPATGKAALVAKNIALANLWLRMVATRYGTVVDVHRALRNNTIAGDEFLPAYDSGDGVHPSTSGHRQIALALAAAMAPRYKLSQVLDEASSLLLNANPYFSGNSATGWYEQAGGTGTAPTYSFVADTSGFLKRGVWREMDFTATAGGTRNYSTAISTGFTAGDRLALTAKIQIEDMTGNWQSIVNTGAGGGGSLALTIQNQSAARVNGGPIFGQGSPGASPNFYEYGPFWHEFIPPAGTTQLLVWANMTLPTGSRVKMRVGEVGVVNLTTNALVGVI